MLHWFIKECVKNELQVMISIWKAEWGPYVSDNGNTVALLLCAGLYFRIYRKTQMSLVRLSQI